METFFRIKALTVKSHTAPACVMFVRIAAQRGILDFVRLLFPLFTHNGRQC